jgi:hypothetical protein
VGHFYGGATEIPERMARHGIPEDTFGRKFM